MTRLHVAARGAPHPDTEEPLGNGEQPGRCPMVITMSRETSEQAMYAQMKARLATIVPDVELRQVSIGVEMIRVELDRLAQLLFGGGGITGRRVDSRCENEQTGV